MAVKQQVEELIYALGHWLPNPRVAQFCGLGEGSSFSGAGLWRVEHGGQVYVLRRWPPAAGKGCHINRITWLQRHLAEAGLPVATPLQLLEDPESLLFSITSKVSGEREISTWTLTSWLPGVADYWTYPRPAKLKAALRTLADIHLAATSFNIADAHGKLRVARSPALSRRADRLATLQAGDLAELKSPVTRAPASLTRELAFHALAHAERALPRLGHESHRWRDEPLPLQWVLRDVWHDHLLFTEDRVTGVLDFGAAAVDSPAGDVARLLGSLVGDDEAAWQLGLDAYASRRQLAPDELAAARFFDASGTLLSAMNWVHWLYRDSTALGPNVDLPAAHRRLERLVARLRSLAPT
ncbi:phosphotransferase enzyme family protein [Lacipirellula sp.]|uniref:phosphotransferase enzyme family protein n=1 Tax=Lacipirellula sp. TaxID=2691419 RepID=UPI003D0A22D2